VLDPGLSVELPGGRTSVLPPGPIARNLLDTFRALRHPSRDFISTIKTLHHYDDLGLLRPAHIDASTSYRFYTLEQLPRLRRIMALKELGLSLEQFGLLLDGEVPAEQIRRIPRPFNLQRVSGR
jgi:hypothetical protein